jgi:hypothetical protein
MLKEVFATLEKIIGNVKFYLLCVLLRECASDQSAIFVGTDSSGLQDSSKDIQRVTSCNLVLHFFGGLLPVTQ